MLLHMSLPFYLFIQAVDKRGLRQYLFFRSFRKYGAGLFTASQVWRKVPTDSAR
uniref:Uncharacterized protein n=1 Tax=Meloidogyne enterolobii TaxID=390850 RepID=A0A6V7UQS2_MELEN|nr:unnamed protein product [Meloidogyne enterolobii]